MKLILGIDPDSKAHGVAVYDDGVLIDLRSMTLMQIIDYTTWCGDITIHIENVNGVSAAFGARDGKGNIHVKLKIAQHIGQCKQAQLELERFFEHKGIKVVHHPISKKWKKERKEFEELTGWEGQSYEDTRSAAFLGYTAVKIAALSGYKNLDSAG